MSDRYLWDRSGPPDPEIERLEKALAPLRYRHRAGVVAERHAPRRVWMAAAAAVVLAAIALWQMRMPLSPTTSWQVASLEGAAQLDNQSAAVSMPVRAGQLVRTSAGSELTLESEDVGKVDLGPDSELRAATNKRMALNRGRLHAFIWARPRQFVVDTPSARAVDLGCEYTIDLDQSGNGVLRVQFGWVAFQYGDHESFIPAGAECVTRKHGGPGIPYYEDAAQPWRDELAAYDRGDSAALEPILATARDRDALTLWHLLTRTSDRDRPAVFDRFAQLVNLPPDVTRDGVLHKNPKMIDLCWNALNLENTEWWRGWERRW
jgi:hypothetical protein